MRKTGSLWVLLGLWATLLPAQTWTGDEAVSLQVNDSKGRPVSGSRVIFTFQGVTGELGPDIVGTDTRGRAVIANIAPGPWQVEVINPDYLSYIAMVDVRRGKKPLVSASFLEAGGRSLAPVKVKFSKGDALKASPSLEARMPAAAPAPEPAIAQQEPVEQVAEVPPTPEPTEPAEETPPPEPESTAAPVVVAAVAEPEPEIETPAPQEQPAIEPPPAPTVEPRPLPEEEPADMPDAAIEDAAVPTAEPVVEEVPSPVEVAEVVAEVAEPVPAPSPDVTEAVAEPTAAPAAAPTQDVSLPVAEITAEPTPQPPAPARAALPPPADPGASVTSRSAGTCTDCQSAEWTLQVSTGIPAADAASGGACEAEVLEAARAAMRGLSTSIQLELDGFLGPVANGTAQEAIRRAEPDLAAPFEGELAAYFGGQSPCQIVGLVLPRAVRFSRVSYSAGDRQGSGGCTPGQTCRIGEAAWLGSALVERGPSSTVVFALFENRSTEWGRRAFLTAFYRPPNANWKPRIPAAD